MPDCTTQQAAYNLAVATEAVRYAQMLVSSAEAQLDQHLYYEAQSARYMAYYQLQQCQMGGMGPPMMSASDSHEKLLRANVELLKLIYRDRLRACNELAG